MRIYTDGPNGIKKNEKGLVKVRLSNGTTLILLPTDIARINEEANRP